MQVRILGARQGESSRSHFSSILVDGALALDAGSLTSVLTLQEQAGVDNVLLTHQHFDHIKDLASLGFNRLRRGQVGIHCTPEVRAAVDATVLNPAIWLNFFALPSPEQPTFVYTPVHPGQCFNVAGYQVRPISVRHAVPAVAYAITSPTGGALLYTGDSGRGSGAGWASARADLIITEVTYCNADTALAAEYGHLSPDLLVQELERFRHTQGYLPRVAITHVNPYYESQIADEVAAVAHHLSADIWLPDEGSIITIGPG